MRFYTKQHRYSCGIDLHAKTMYVCILNQEGEMVFHRNLPSAPDAFLRAIAAYREDLVVAVECIFTCLRAARTGRPDTGWLISAPA